MLKSVKITNFMGFKDTIEFKINGDISIVHGLSGSGKTSLLKAIMKLKEFSDRYLMVWPAQPNTLYTPSKFEYYFEINGILIVYVICIKNSLIQKETITVGDNVWERKYEQKKFTLIKNLLPDFLNGNLEMGEELKQGAKDLACFIESIKYFDLGNLTDEEVGKAYAFLRGSRAKITVQDFFTTKMGCNYCPNLWLGLEPTIPDRQESFVLWNQISSSERVLITLFVLLKQNVFLGNPKPLWLFDNTTSFLSTTVARRLIKILSEANCSCVLTTAHTDLMSFGVLDSLDQFYECNLSHVASLDTLTIKDIKKEHNLEKLVRGGHFDKAPPKEEKELCLNH